MVPRYMPVTYDLKLVSYVKDLIVFLTNLQIKNKVFENLGTR